MAADSISPSQHFVLEWMFSQALIFVAFGVGLDPRQGKIFGPAYAPLLVGTTLGFGTLASGQDAIGYSGLGKLTLRVSTHNAYADVNIRLQLRPLLGLDDGQAELAKSLDPMAWAVHRCCSQWVLLSFLPSIRSEQANVGSQCSSSTCVDIFGLRRSVLVRAGDCFPWSTGMRTRDSDTWSTTESGKGECS